MDNISNFPRIVVNIFRYIEVREVLVYRNQSMTGDWMAKRGLCRVDQLIQYNSVYLMLSTLHLTEYLIGNSSPVTAAESSRNLSYIFTA
jgi:hypothetical protein